MLYDVVLVRDVHLGALGISYYPIQIIRLGSHNYIETHVELGSIGLEIIFLHRYFYLRIYFAKDIN